MLLIFRNLFVNCYNLEFVSKDLNEICIFFWLRFFLLEVEFFDLKLDDENINVILIELNLSDS